MTYQTTSLLTPAQIEWKNNRPFSRQYEDIYHSTNYQQEAEIVYLQGNNLQKRFKENNRTFCLLEHGFGFGLNFIETIHLFLQHNTEGHLHYFSYEKHPIALKDMQRFWLNYPEFPQQKLSQTLLNRYPPFITQWHTLSFASQKITLSLFFGDGLTALKDLTDQPNLSIDAFFFDGFDPKKNNQLWSEELFKHTAQLSHQETTLSSFSSSKVVIDRLTAQGFHIKKYHAPPLPKKYIISGKYSLPSKQTKISRKKIAIIGDGIAGCASAHRLSLKHEVTLFGLKPSLRIENHQKASSNPYALFHPKLQAPTSMDTPFFQRAQSYAFSLLKSFHAFEQTGIIHLKNETNKFFQHYDKWKEFHPQIEMTKLNTISSLASYNNATEALLMKQGGIVNLSDLCRSMISKVNHLTLTDIDFSSIKKEFDYIILCLGESSLKWPWLITQYLNQTPGQINVTTSNIYLNKPIAGNGFMLSKNNTLIIGSTYENQIKQSKNPTQFNSNRAIQSLQQFGLNIPSLHTQEVFRGIRCIARDRLPLIGHLYDNFYINTGHSSYGSISGIYSGLLLEKLIQNELIQGIKEDSIKVTPYRFKKKSKG